MSAGKESKEVIYIESTGLECLTPRQACGIESAARANPEMSISVHVNTMRIGGHHEEQHIFRPGRVRSCALNEMLADRYNNVRFIKENFLDLLRGSEFWPLIESRKIQLSPWSDVQVSDAVRLILLYKSGGIYLDFDNVVFRPLHCLKNTLSYLKEAPNIENGIMVSYYHPKVSSFLHYVLLFLRSWMLDTHF